MRKPPGCQRVRGDGRWSRKYAYNKYDYQFKLQTINHYRQCKCIQSTINRFFPDVADEKRKPKSNLVYKWVKQRALIEICASSASTLSQCRVRDVGVGTTLSFDAEATIVEWVNDCRQDGVPISPTMLRLKALEVASESGVESGFSASWQWRRGFALRHRLSFRSRTHHGQFAPADALAQAQAFAADVRRTMEVEGIKIVFNADQTGVFFELLPRTTLAPTGSTTVWVKCGKKDKQRMTAMLLGDSEGNRYPLFIVMKSPAAKAAETREENRRLRNGFGRRVWAEVSPLQDKHDVRVYGNETAWWNGYMTVKFLMSHFGHRSVFSDPILLLLDDFSVHWTDEVVECAQKLRIVLKKVPPGLTWISQPADVVWIKPMKDRLRRSWVSYLQEQLKQPRDQTTPFSMVPPDRRIVTGWIAEAWNDLSTATIKAGFRKCLTGMDAPELPPIETDPVFQQTVNAVVAQLEDLSLLDTVVGEVRDEDDFVDSSIELEPSSPLAQKVVNRGTPFLHPYFHLVDCQLTTSLAQVNAQRPGWK